MTTKKTERKRKTKDPCERCFLHKDLCLCSLIPRLDLKTRVVLVVHAKELKRTTNTGRLALHALVNSKIFVRGQDRESLDLSSILGADYEHLLLYPSKDAIEMSEFILRPRLKPVQLIVPDGNWRQASKVPLRHLELQNIQRVKFTSKNVATTHLRKEHFIEGFSTIEAIAMALGFIEGSTVKGQLMDLYKAKLRATLQGRGRKIKID